MLISSHDLTEIEELCNEVLILKDGELVMDNNSIRAKRRAGNNQYELIIKGNRDAIQEILTKHSALKEVKFSKEAESGVYVFLVKAKDTRDIRDSLFTYLAGKKYQVYGIRRLEHSLEDVFMEATGEEE